MVRRVTLAVMLIASIIFDMCASAAVRRQRIVDWDGMFSFAAEDVNVWLADDEGVWLSYKRTTPQFLLKLAGVTALDAYDGSVYALRKDEGDDIVSFIEPENGVTREWLLPDLGGYCGIAALQDKIALLAGNPEADQCNDGRACIGEVVVSVSHHGDRAGNGAREILDCKQDDIQRDTDDAAKHAIGSANLRIIVIPVIRDQPARKQFQHPIISIIFYPYYYTRIHTSTRDCIPTFPLIK